MGVKKNCPVCESGNILIFLQRLQVPVQQNNFYATAEEAKNCQRGDLRMAFCENCGFVFNAAFDDELMRYSSSYNNVQETSAHFVDHLEKMRKRITDTIPANARIVEVGCGKGFFFKSLIADEKMHYQGIGMDAAYEGEETMFGGRLRFFKRYFDHECVDMKPDAVVCRHVIEHVADPRTFLHEIKLALKEAPDCRLFFETPCINWIFRTATIWDFFYEHCSIFSPDSLKFLFESCGFKVNRVDQVFSGQYLWLEGQNKCETIAVEPTSTPTLLHHFIKEEQRQSMAWQSILQQKNRNGKVAVWGAGAKGVTFANLFDPQQNLVDCLIDVNPAKQGLFVPATAHRVCGPERLLQDKFAAVIVMNPNYLGEIARKIEKMGIVTELITEPGEHP